MACQLLGRLGHNPSIKDSVREFLGVIHMLKLLKKSSTSARLAEVILQALTILLVDNEVNQDQVRSVTLLTMRVHQEEESEISIRFKIIYSSDWTVLLND